MERIVLPEPRRHLLAAANACGNGACAHDHTHRNPRFRFHWAHPASNVEFVRVGPVHSGALAYCPLRHASTPGWGWFAVLVFAPLIIAVSIYTVDVRSLPVAYTLIALLPY